jgi:hypothetical protein
MTVTNDAIIGTTSIEEDPISGELYLTFPDEIADAVGMKDWEYVNWDINEDGTVTITKADTPGSDEADHF